MLFRSGLAARIMKEHPHPTSDLERLKYAFVLCLGRTPSNSELQTLEAVLRNETEVDGTNESSWMTVARVLLNLDEFVTRE